jgi:hypothetical protein
MMCTFESVDVLRSLEVADEEAALAIDGIDDAAPVLGINLFSLGCHFRNNL